MAIRGRLDELQAAEVLQFLTQSGRTGTLRLQEGRFCKFLAFENGRLVFAVSQQELPPLPQILYQRGKLETLEERHELRFDDEVSKALEWRRSGDPARTPGAFPRTRLGRILVQRGRLKDSELADVLDPKRMPEAVFEDVLVHAGALSREAIVEVRKHAASNMTLHAAIVKTKALTPEQVSESIACMPEKMLARLLAHFGHVTNNEAAYCADQLDTLRGQSRPSFRIGEYLVACGKISQKQLEKALAVQLTRRVQLGAILIEQEVLTRDDIVDADREIAELRMEFSPLRVLRDRLIRDHGFTTETFAQARVQHLSSERSLAAALIETGLVAEADLRKLIEDILTAELSDLLLWNEGAYEFFDGFSLADAIGDDGLGRIHGYSFEVSSLLLDAHYRVDELRRKAFKTLGPKCILEPTGLDGSTAPSNLDLRLLARMDGERPLAEVCAALPGNLLTHCHRIAGFVEAGWALPLTREAAARLGREQVATGDFAQAIAYFQHATCAPGEAPDGATLAMWSQHAKHLASRNLFRRMLHGFGRTLRRCASLPPLRKLGQLGFVAATGRAIASGFGTVRARLGRSMRRVSLSFQDFMIQKGLARHWWTVRHRILNPLAGWGGRRAPRIATSFVILALVSVAMLIPGVTDFSTETPVTPGTTEPRPFQALRSPIKKIRFDAPVDVAPAVTDIAMFVSTRDGYLRSVPLTGSSKVAGWNVPLGEFGDLLSTPTLFRDRLYVTNVRGSVHAITTAGAKLWTKKFPRVESIAPAVASDAHGKPLGVAVVARESVIVLDPEDGRELYRLRSGNIIQARPIVAGGLLFVGSEDNHVYCCDWQKGLVLWDVEVGKDVHALSRVEGVLLARLRNGAIVALRSSDGDRLWREFDETNPILGVRRVGDRSVSFEMSQGGVQIHDVATGGLLKRVRPTRTDLSVRLLMTNSTYFYYSERGDLGQVDEEGNNLWSCQQSLRRITSLTLRRSRLVVTSAEGAVWLFSLKDKDARGVSADD